MKTTLMLIMATLVQFSTVTAKTFHIDPDGGSAAGDGSASDPWGTLQEVFEGNLVGSRKYADKPAEPGAALTGKNPDAPVQSGDTLLCYSGYHGAVLASEYYNEDWIVIMAAPGQIPKLASLELRSSEKWYVAGLTISPSFAEEFTRKTIFAMSSHNWTGPIRECIAEACTCYSVSDVSGWTKDDWNTLSCNGISLSGASLTARNNVFRNVNFGISVSGDSCLVEGNTVENFSGDGMRGLGDYDVFRYNMVKNCYDVNENHDDGFQSWSLDDSGKPGGGVVYGLVLEGNTIINYEDPDQPFRGALQGIGCFDGMFSGWKVFNNVVITDHWHGITLMGAEDCEVVNNTVVDINDEKPGPPWVRVVAHKNGTPCSGCVVRNNLTTSLNCDSVGVMQDHNVIVKEYSEFFVNYAANDLHLLHSCGAVDAGAAEMVPTVDRDGVQRPVGDGVDVGAYEYDPSGVLLPERGRRVSGVSFRRYGNSLVVKLPEGNGIVALFDLAGRTVVQARADRRGNAVLPLDGIGGQVLLLQYRDLRGRRQVERVIR